MSSQNNAPNEMGTADIGKLLISYALPSIAAQMVSSIYNVVDSIFIGRGVEPLAIAGFGITLPLMNLAAAFGALVGAGGGTLISIKLGQKDKDGANNVLGNVVVLNIIIGISVMLFGLLFMDKILVLFGASNETISFARDFMEVILYGNVITHLYFGLLCAVRSCGFPKKAMTITMVSVVVNIILCPIFIFWLNLGIRGAALATVIAQTCGLTILLAHFMDKQKYIRLYSKFLRLKSDIVKGIISVGLSPFMLNICACLVVIIINNQLKNYGSDYAIGAYGIVNKMLMLFAMLVLGLNQGMQPIAGYNYGAKQYGRVTEVFKKTVLYATAVMIVAFIVCECFPHAICSIFTDDEQMTDISANAMRIMILAFPIVGFQMVTSNFFQSIGKAVTAAILSTTRQLLFLIPSLLILPKVFGLNGVWYSMPVSDVISTVVAVFLLTKEYRKLKAVN
ncbi:MAG: MATE family efflux transporter [Bacteroidales bacterium]|nr:MATE family efflux transporter [Bacteroidales bacterium]